VLDEAGQHLAFESGLRRDLAGALAYPALLVSAATAVFLFLFSTVVPRFVAMVGDRRSEIDGLGRAVLDLGAFFAQSPILAFGAVLFVPVVIAAVAATTQGRAALLRQIAHLPIVGALANARARAMWARIMAFALGAGVGMAPAADLAAASAGSGPFRDAVLRGNRAMRSGKPVHEAFGAEQAFDPIDRSLMRAGEKSGAYAPMFAAIAERHEDHLRRRLKLVVTFLEQAAIAFVAVSIGAVVISLVTAITTLYDTIGA
jgi:type II secretory pathway component PulF